MEALKMANWGSSIKLGPAQTIFEPVGITIAHNETLGIYECEGYITGQARTLTALCIGIVQALKAGKTAL
jgi:hypothetical protein